MFVVLVIIVLLVRAIFDQNKFANPLRDRGERQNLGCGVKLSSSLRHPVNH